MTIEITGESDPPDALQQGGVQMQDQASDTTVLITEAQVALGTAAATECPTEGPSVGCATEPDLRARAEAITPEAASLPTPHGVSGPPANGTRDGATMSPLRGRACEQTREGPTMLSPTRGTLAMLPVVFGVAGYAMGFR
jgi:hypothetical protein